MVKKLPRIHIQKKQLVTLALVSVILFAATFRYNVDFASAATITSASVQLGDSRLSATNVTYTVGFTFPSTTNLQCIKVIFATASDLATPATNMTSASGFTLSGGGLTQGNWTNYGSTNGTLEIYAGTNQAPTATAATITWTGVTNTSINGAFYAQIQTYSTQSSSGASCTGLVDSSNVMALTTVPGVTVTATVDPSISFSLANYGSAVNGSPAPGITTTSTTIPFGTLTPGTGVVGAHTATVSTNASGGYILYIRYTGPLTNGVQNITNTTGSNGSPTSFSGSSSTSAFGYITDDADETQFTSDTWAAFTTTNAEVARAAGPVNADANHIAYQALASNTQAPGSYQTTVTYTVTPTY